MICGKSRSGGFLVRRQTRRDRMRAKLKEIKGELRRRMHRPIPEQGKWLRQVVTGFFAYHAVPTNGRALAAFRYHVIGLWRRALRRRGQRDDLTWGRIAALADDWLPRPRSLHPWPQQRFTVKHPRFRRFLRHRLWPRGAFVRPASRTTQSPTASRGSRLGCGRCPDPCGSPGIPTLVKSPVRRRSCRPKKDRRCAKSHRQGETSSRSYLSEPHPGSAGLFRSLGRQS
jgi:hypothetical protein